MTNDEILQLALAIYLLVIGTLAFGCITEAEWIFPKLDRWLKKRKKKREQRKAAAARQ